MLGLFHTGFSHFPSFLKINVTFIFNSPNVQSHNLEAALAGTPTVFSFPQYLFFSKLLYFFLFLLAAPIRGCHSRTSFFVSPVSCILLCHTIYLHTLPNNIYKFLFGLLLVLLPGTSHHSILCPIYPHPSSAYVQTTSISPVLVFLRTSQYVLCYELKIPSRNKVKDNGRCQK